MAHAHALSHFWAVKTVTPVLLISTAHARAALAWTKKKRSLRNEKLKANRASETEEQRKERLRIEDKTRK